MGRQSRGTYDVVVVGGGVIGAWTALRARLAGWSTILIDAYGIAHPRATSSDETRILRMSHGTDTFYASWAREARLAWITFGHDIGQQIFHETGMLWFAHREDGFEAAGIAPLTSLGVPIQRLEPPDVRERWPVIGVSDLLFATYESEAGLLLARAGVAAVLKSFTAAGGRVEISEVHPGAYHGRRMAEVAASNGSRYKGGTFVFAAGPWLPRLFPSLLSGLIAVTRQDVVLLGPAPGDHRFDLGRLPVWADYDGPFYGAPSVSGGVKISPDRDGPRFDPDLGDRVVDHATIHQVRAYARLRFPDLATAPVIEARVCQYEATPDTEFIIDQHPDFDNVWIAGGGSGHAYKHGPVIGNYLVSRMAGMLTAAEDERFSLSRPRRRGVHLRSSGAHHD